MAHSDKNTILFERIKTILTLIARGGSPSSEGGGHEESKSAGGLSKEALATQNKDRKILMTEIVGLVLKPTKDAKMHQAYIDCFVSITKQFCDLDDKLMQNFVVFTYKELLKKFLGGRGAPAHCLNQQFFKRVFEECGSGLGLRLMKSLLRYFLSNIKDTAVSKETENKLAESEMSAADSSAVDKASPAKTSSRSNHQRLQAIEIFNSLVKATQKNNKLLVGLAEQLDLITSVIISMLKSADSWQQKKVKKTMLCLNIFTKLAKTIISDDKLKKKSTKAIQQNGALLIKSIEEECEKDKSMSNLKGKIKEIQALMENA